MNTIMTTLKNINTSTATLRAILIDDEVNCLKMLEWELSDKCPEVEIVGVCSTGKAGLMAIKEEQPDIVFLDIEMPYLNGFEVLELVSEVNFDIIFTTAYDKFAVRAFKSSATDYLLKPIDGDDLRLAVDKVLEKREKSIPNTDVKFLLQQLEDAKNDKMKRIALPTFEGLTFVQIDEIIYCQSDNNYSHVILKEGRKMLISKTLKEVEEILSSTLFFRVHNSFFVNLKEVSNYIKADGGALIMTNGDEVRVSRSRKDRLMELLTA
jgi:two-component system LytT family response regulator